ncbi:MAG: HK97 gp10 family phage protein [Oscillospiraceae bacterium]|nr:HK97 gp10 family phage protein [Oscillospiraceae bacterium]
MANDIENGLRLFGEDLRKIAETVTDKKVQAKALEAGAKPIVSHAKLLAPRGATGRLAQSIGAEYNQQFHNVGIGIGAPISTAPGSTGFYGRFQNDGWSITGRRNSRGRTQPTGRRTQARNYLGKALDAQFDNATKIVADDLRQKTETN